MAPITGRADALRVERDATIELAARALRFRDENTGRFVIASTSYCTTPLRYVGGTYRLDIYLDDPLTFADRAEADKLASHWNALRGDGQDMTVSLFVEDFYNAFANQLDSALLFDEQEALAQLPYEIVTLTRSELEQRVYRHADKVADHMGEERSGFRAKFGFWLDILLAEFNTLGRIRWLGVEYRRAPSAVDQP
jgi:hypothetical protein